MTRMNRPKVALLIDTANCRNVDKVRLLKAANRFGELVVAEAYANFANSEAVAAAAEVLFLKNVQLIHCPAWNNGSGELKSTADEMLMSRMLRLAQSQPSITRLILASGDGHFIPAVLEARRRGREVIVLAEGRSASRQLKQAADHFVGLPSLAVPVPDVVYKALAQAVEEAIQYAQGKTWSYTVIKQRMEQLLGSFDESRFLDRRGRPFASFTDFYHEAEGQGRVPPLPRPAQPPQTFRPNGHSNGRGNSGGNSRPSASGPTAIAA